METVFINANSHRAREKVTVLVGGEYIVDHYENGLTGRHAFLIPLEFLEQARKIKGVTKSRNQDHKNWSRCWSLCPENYKI